MRVSSRLIGKQPRSLARSCRFPSGSPFHAQACTNNRRLPSSLYLNSWFLGWSVAQMVDY